MSPQKTPLSSFPFLLNKTLPQVLLAIFVDLGGDEFGRFSVLHATGNILSHDKIGTGIDFTPLQMNWIPLNNYQWLALEIKCFTSEKQIKTFKDSVLQSQILMTWQWPIMNCYVIDLLFTCYDNIQNILWLLFVTYVYIQNILCHKRRNITCVSAAFSRDI